jgi:hypothetical protein
VLHQRTAILSGLGTRLNMPHRHHVPQSARDTLLIGVVANSAANSSLECEAHAACQNWQAVPDAQHAK